MGTRLAAYKNIPAGLKNKENRHAVQQLETITFLGGGRSFQFNGRTLRVQNAPKQSAKNIFIIFVSEAHFCKAVGRLSSRTKRKIIKARIMLA